MSQPIPKTPKGKSSIPMAIAGLSALGIGIMYMVFKEDKREIKKIEAMGGPKGGVKPDE